MILGISYEEATKMFLANFQSDGIKHDHGVGAILGHGWIGVTKTVEAYDHKDDHRKFMLTPFAEIHLLTVFNYADSKNGHAVVMLDDGSLLDPGTSLAADQYWYVRRSTGFWRTKK